MSLLQYFRPRNEKYLNDKTLPSPAGSLSTFSLSLNTFYSDSSRKLFCKEGDETKRKIAISFNFDSRAAISSGKRAYSALKETSVHIMPVIECSYNGHQRKSWHTINSSKFCSSKFSAHTIRQSFPPVKFLCYTLPEFANVFSHQHFPLYGIYNNINSSQKVSQACIISKSRVVSAIIKKGK